MYIISDINLLLYEDSVQYLHFISSEIVIEIYTMVRNDQWRICFFVDIRNMITYSRIQFSFGLTNIARNHHMRSYRPHFVKKQF